MMIAYQAVKTDTSVRLRRVFNAPVARVYSAWTNPAMMNEWFHPGRQVTSQCEVDLRVGGRYRIAMHPPQGEPYVVGGTYQEIIPDEKLVFTWRWAQADGEGEMLITLEFNELSPNETEVVLTHSQFPNQEERDSHEMGWVSCFDNLELALVG